MHRLQHIFFSVFSAATVFLPQVWDSPQPRAAAKMAGSKKVINYLML